MNILHIIEDLNPALGGPSTVVVRLAAAQAALGHTVNILGFLDPKHQADHERSIANVPGIEQVYLEVHAMPSGAAWILSRPALPALHRMVPRADVLHLHGVWDPLLRNASEIARKHQVPYVVRPCGMLDPWALAQRPLKKRVAMFFAYRRMINQSMYLHVLNADEFRLLNLLAFEAPAEIIPNGIFTEELDIQIAPGTFRRLHPEIGSDPYILFLSRLHHKKGLDFLGDAFARIAPERKNLRLVVAGPDGGDRARFEEQVRQLGVADRVHLVGPLYGEAKYAALADAACFCLPSRQEGFSLAITEALGMGVPVVISSECHFPEVASSGAGRVTELDAEAVADGLEDVLRRPRARLEMGRAGAKMVRENFTWPKIAQHTIEGYELHFRRMGRVVPSLHAPIKVLHVLSSMAVAAGGPPFVAAGLAAALAARGHAVTIATAARPGETRVPLDLKVNQVEFPILGSDRYVSSPAMDVWLQANVHKFDLLHLHSIWQFPTFAAARACWFNHKPYVVLLNGMLEHYSVHHRSLWLKTLYWHWREKYIETGASGVHFLNTAEIRKAVSWTHPLNKFIIGNGISEKELANLPARGHFRASNPAFGNRPIVLFLSRLHPKKGLERLLPAWKRVATQRPDILFVIAGKGEAAHEQSIDRVIVEQELGSSVMRVGQLAGQQKWEALVDADVFVLPSHQEGFSMAITEALAAGCVPVVTEECNFDELDESKCGVIIHDGDMAEFVFATLDLLDHPERRKTHAAAGRALVAQRYTWEKIAENLEQVYRWVIAGRMISLDGTPNWQPPARSHANTHKTTDFIYAEDL